jgi:hypothetical protein
MSGSTPSPGNGLRLSVILATDAYETIRPVIERLRRQTIRQQIELVLVAPSAASVSSAMRHQAEFAAIRTVESPIEDLAEARAAGIRAAAAPVVFVGETHSYPHPQLAEALTRALDGPWVAAAPAFGNANPKGTLSWAAFLSDYARWAEGLPQGEIPEVPLYNAAYKRTALLELGDRLGLALAHGDELPKTMRARGYRTYFEPAARIDHVNVSKPGDWLKERFVAGLLIASHRARQWPLAKRLGYIAGSILIPAVLAWRVLPGVRQTTRRLRLPPLTVPMIVLGMAVKGMGEFFGYAGSRTDQAEKQMHEYEIHKLAYAARGKL